MKIPKQALGDTPIDSRGHPSYMAPELFTTEGCYSFQSDFWALGCILYELRRGFTPFGDASTSTMDDLIGRIRSSEPVFAPILPPNSARAIDNNNNNNHNSNNKKSRNNNTKDRSNSAASLHSNNSHASGNDHLTTVVSMSAELADLLLWLLEKSPVSRCDWCVFVLVF